MAQPQIRDSQAADPTSTACALEASAQARDFQCNRVASGVETNPAVSWAIANPGMVGLSPAPRFGLGAAAAALQQSCVREAVLGPRQSRAPAEGVPHAAGYPVDIDPRKVSQEVHLAMWIFGIQQGN